VSKDSGFEVLRDTLQGDFRHAQAFTSVVERHRQKGLHRSAQLATDEGDGPKTDHYRHKKYPTGKKRMACMTVTQAMCDTGLFHYARSCQMEAAPIALAIVEALEASGYLKFDQ
jgi:hypothetical protein